MSGYWKITSPSHVLHIIKIQQKNTSIAHIYLYIYECVQYSSVQYSTRIELNTISLFAPIFSPPLTLSVCVAWSVSFYTFELTQNRDWIGRRGVAVGFYKICFSSHIHSWYSTPNPPPTHLPFPHPFRYDRLVSLHFFVAIPIYHLDFMRPTPSCVCVCACVFLWPVRLDLDFSGLLNCLFNMFQMVSVLFLA